MRINLEYLIDLVTDSCDQYEEYVKVGKRVQPGIEGVNYYQWQETAYEKYQSAVSLLEMTTEQDERLWSAAKAIRKWRVKTNNERLIPWELSGRLYEFIFEGKGMDYCNSFDMYI